MSGGSPASICLSSAGPGPDLLGEGDEIVEETFFAGNQTETAMSPRQTHGS